ncbi:Fpg/Nei family DNA glycosylase [Corynebacterium anserum]|uniref:Formamidopyrimidine-DNA glycosylase n=1 Tax=Corynebacterium anserum TaxID=2684406 RepID=A0A7G7YNX8_9CORY|nr:Fpg/Nei family DNA glycosylase [Corynebacterium anserum]QNH96198.1 DNA-formamidopyrimidine glycosylase [Corynebacterium anserum]
MPELPEVEVVRRGLEKYVVGRVFDGVEVLSPRAVRCHVGEPLPRLLYAATVVSVRRRGKFLWLELSQDPNADTGLTCNERLALVVHLGMSGQMLVTEPDQVASSHLRIRARLSCAPSRRGGGLLSPGFGDRLSPTRSDDGLEHNGLNDLNFVDQRTFGRWEVVPMVDDPFGEYEAVPTSATHIAPDPLEPHFDIASVVEKIASKRSPIKSILLDQRVISGIGNIYADEALWLSGIRPTRKPERISKRRVEKTIRAAETVMRKALAAGGTSFDSLYVNVNGASGYFSRSLNVYGRENEPCRRCQTPIKRVVLSGRSSHYCPRCQK